MEQKNKKEQKTWRTRSFFTLLLLLFTIQTGHSNTEYQWSPSVQFVVKLSMKGFW